MLRPICLRMSLLACALAACGDQPAATPAGRATPAARSAAPSSSDTIKRQGLWSDSITAESRFSAGYVNDTLVVIEEQMVFADGMRSDRAYFYDATLAPARIVEDRTFTATSGNSTPTTLRSRVTIFLTGETVDSSSKTVDLVPKPLQPYDIENLRTHERLIFARVAKTNEAP